MKLAVLGTGLIGTSVGLALSEAGHDVVGWDPSAGAREAASGRGLATVDARDAAMRDVEVVFLAAPVSDIIALLPELRTPALVTDVGGVKSPVVAAAGHLRFVGGHPMAGREVSGADAASGALFRGAAWVVTTDAARPEDVAVVRGLVEDIGANPVEMTAADHDAAVAVVSHLPHVIAAALLELADDAGAFSLAAGSFRDLTRVAGSDPAAISGLLELNRSAVSAAGERLRQALARVTDSPGDAFVAARRRRDALAPPAAAVQVAIDDRPGQIAAVGRAVDRAGVDVRDLQLRHGRHGGGGVLTLSVAPSDRATLEQAIVAEGLWVVGSVEQPEQ